MSTATVSTATTLSPEARRDPVGALYVVMAAVGAGFLGIAVVAAARDYVAASIAALVVLVPYAAAWLLVIRHHRLYGQFVPGIAVIAFAWGGLACFEMAAKAEGGAANILWRIFGPGVITSGAWEGLTAGPIEEGAKMLGVVVLFVLLAPRLRSPFEAMLIGAGCGLGFQIIEDFMYISGSDAPLGGNGPGTIMQTLVLRLGLGFWSHTLFTAIAGCGVGFLLTRHGGRRWVGLGLMLAAILIHTSFDTGIGNTALPGAARTGFVLLAVVGSSVIFVFAYKAAVHRDRAWALDRLASETGAGLVTPDDLVGMATTTVHGRRRYRKHVSHGRGRHAPALVARHQRALGALAGVLDDADGATTPNVTRARADLAKTRDALVAAGIVDAPATPGPAARPPAAPDNVAPSPRQEPAPKIDPVG